jgi:hypothetical protein
MNGHLAPELLAVELAAAVRDHLVHVHVELRPATGHPDVEREHVGVPAGRDLVANSNDEVASRSVESPDRVIRGRGRPLQDRVGRDHLAGHQLAADAEVLQRTLRLGSPELVGGDGYLAQAIVFLARRGHGRGSDVAQMKDFGGLGAHAPAQLGVVD